MKLLLDTGIYIHSEFGVWVKEKCPFGWGPRSTTVDVMRVQRVPLHPDPLQQAERDMLFTIGRLIREGKIEPYDYNELIFERFRMRMGRVVYALDACKMLHCEPALHRTKFRKTINTDDVIRKGGKKDLAAGKEPSDFTQIAFMEWLLSLSADGRQLLIDHGKQLGLTDFEIASIQQLDWFGLMCARSASSENYVDVFHLWTAERNGIGFLTLDKKIKRLVERVLAEKSCPIQTNVRVYHPSDVLREFGIEKPDPVPIEPDRLYPFGHFPV